MLHAVPVLWRLHMMHHADLDFDLTTGSRFHPIEIIISLLIKMAVVVLIGAPAVSVVIFEVLLNGTSMFNHSNLFVPVNVDRVLRLWVVTPDMHRVHHSVIDFETSTISALICRGGTDSWELTRISRNSDTKG
jgi:sterol desaturase/sphingolipid hydroxylase (fatty acid hydroxylase superfamily)